MGRNVAGDEGCRLRVADGTRPFRPRHVAGREPGYEFGARGLRAGRHRNGRQQPDDDRPVPGFEFDGSAPPAGRHRVVRAGTHGYRPSGSGAAFPAAPWPDEPGRRSRTGWSPRESLANGAASIGLTERASRIAFTVAVAVAAVSFGIIVSANIGRPAAHHAAPLPAGAFPAATLAGQDFVPYQAGSTRGITELQGRVASSGDEVVAVGAQTGGLLPRAQFFVSLNDGRSWTLGTVSAAGGGTPPPGFAAKFVAGGAGRWAAIGPDSLWTSSDGQSWTLGPAGLPERPGDWIAVLKQTGAGFIAAGANAPAGGQAGSAPVIFLSATGSHWTRLGAVRLAAAGGRVTGIRLAAAAGNRILIAGDIVRTGLAGPRGARQPVSVRTGGAWLSDDGGRSWIPVQVPADHGAEQEFSDAVSIAGGFLLVRPAVVNGVPAADVYLSGNGTTWRFAATLTAPAGFTPGLMNGGTSGAVLAGVSGGALTAFVSRDGSVWRPTASFGAAASVTVSGVAVTDAGAVLAAGSGAAVSGSRQQLITVDGATGGLTSIALAAIPGAVEPQLAVNAVAAQGSTQVAVGSANGFPAAWLSVNRGVTWRRAAGQAGMVLDGRGFQQLTGVTHGSAGWLAVGGSQPGLGTPHPLVLASVTGGTWSAAGGSVFSGAGLVTRQAASAGDLYVIVGDRQGPGARTVAVAWWSAGLAGWHLAGGTSPGGPASSQMLAVAATGTGFVAAGSHGASPAVWISPDGKTWSRADLPLPPGATAGVLQHVAANSRIVVATGMARTAAGRVPFAVQSSDGGGIWRETLLPAPAGGAEATALAAAGAGFTAAGTFGVSPGHRDVVIWTSADGVRWTKATPPGRGLAGPGIQAITGLAASGNLITGVGFTATPAGEQPILWLARIPLTVLHLLFPSRISSL